MLSINQKKQVNSLKQRKFRLQNNYFVVEGVKMLEELLLSNYEVVSIYATENWRSKNLGVDCELVSEKELVSISSLKNPNEVLAVVKMKEKPMTDISSQLTIVLDKLQDPGNLGTIIRTADWFGVKNIVCSTDSVDVYNPKVIQASMGSFFRVNIVYTSLKEFFTTNSDLTVYGALLSGKNVYKKSLNRKGAVLMLGNESKGISDELVPFIQEQLFIPNYGKAESLNVASATAILCSEFYRLSS